MKPHLRKVTTVTSSSSLSSLPSTAIRLREPTPGRQLSTSKISTPPNAQPPAPPTGADVVAYSPVMVGADGFQSRLVWKEFTPEKPTTVPQPEPLRVEAQREEVDEDRAATTRREFKLNFVRRFYPSCFGG